MTGGVSAWFWLANSWSICSSSDNTKEPMDARLLDGLVSIGFKVAILTSAALRCAVGGAYRA